jgi:hypothetical protein
MFGFVFVFVFVRTLDVVKSPFYEVTTCCIDVVTRVNRTVGRPVPTVQKKTAGIPVKPAGSPRVKNIRLGLRVGT